MSKDQWPAWFNGPDGEAAIFHKAEDVPAGWTSGAEKRTASGKPAEKAPEPEPEAESEEIDADGWPWTEGVHVATRTKTQAGLWRMQPGATRPDPKPGFPKLDL